MNDNKQQRTRPSNETSTSQNDLPSALFPEVEAVVWLTSEVGSDPARNYLGSAAGGKGVTMHWPASELTPNNANLRKTWTTLRYPRGGNSGEQSNPYKFQSPLTFLWCQTLKITAGVEGRVPLSLKHATLSHYSILAWSTALQKHKSLGFPTPRPKKERRESGDLRGNKLNLRACKMNSLTRRVLPHPRYGVTAWKHALFSKLIYLLEKLSN